MLSIEMYGFNNMCQRMDPQERCTSSFLFLVANLAPSNKCIASSNKCLTSSNKK